MWWGLPRKFPGKRARRILPPDPLRASWELGLPLKAPDSAHGKSWKHPLRSSSGVSKESPFHVPRIGAALWLNPPVLSSGRGAEADCTIGCGSRPRGMIGSWNGWPRDQQATRRPQGFTGREWSGGGDGRRSAALTRASRLAERPRSQCFRFWMPTKLHQGLRRLRGRGHQM